MTRKAILAIVLLLTFSLGAISVAGCGTNDYSDYYEEPEQEEYSNDDVLEQYDYYFEQNAIDTARDDAFEQQQLEQYEEYEGWG